MKKFIFLSFLFLLGIAYSGLAQTTAKKEMGYSDFVKNLNVREVEVINSKPTIDSVINSLQQANLPLNRFYLNIEDKVREISALDMQSLDAKQVYLINRFPNNSRKFQYQSYIYVITTKSR